MGDYYEDFHSFDMKKFSNSDAEQILKVCYSNYEDIC